MGKMTYGSRKASNGGVNRGAKRVTKAAKGGKMVSGAKRGKNR